MQLFFNPDCESNSFLDENDSKHCVKVLRKKKFDTIHIVDGIGGFFECQITDDNPKKCHYKILSKISEFQKPERYLHIAIAPTKNTDRIEWFVEKSVEIGISEISLIYTSNSERRNQKSDRLNKIAISAMKQALKAYLPKINDPILLKEFINKNTDSQNFVAHLSEDSEPLSNKKLREDVCILIGPEGDFTKEELNLLKEKNYQQVSLGNSRLRTETAGLVAITLLNCN